MGSSESYRSLFVYFIHICYESFELQQITMNKMLFITYVIYSLLYIDMYYVLITIFIKYIQCLFVIMTYKYNN